MNSRPGVMCRLNRKYLPPRRGAIRRSIECWSICSTTCAGPFNQTGSTPHVHQRHACIRGYPRHHLHHDLHRATARSGAIQDRLRRGRLYLMLVLLGTAVTVLSLLLDNVTTVVIFGPLIILIARAQKVSPIPYLMAAALLTDT